MNNDNDIRLTFSQRVGKAPLPEPMHLEHLTKRFRNSVWLCFDEAIKDSSTGLGTFIDEHYIRSQVSKVIQLYIRNITIQPHDIMEHTNSNHKKLLRPLVLNGEYHDVLTLIEYVLEVTDDNHNMIIRKLKYSLLRCFKLATISYTVQDNTEVADYRS